MPTSLRQYSSLCNGVITLEFPGKALGTVSKIGNIVLESATNFPTPWHRCTSSAAVFNSVSPFPTLLHRFPRGNAYTIAV